MTEAPEQFVVQVPQISMIAGPPHFLTLSNIYAVPGVDMFEVVCDTDQYCMLRLTWERTNPPPDPGSSPFTGTVEDVGPVLQHRLAVPDDTFVQARPQETPQEVRYTIDLSPSDTSGHALRPYIGTLKLRQLPTNFVPVRFYNFGDTPPPVPGGDSGDWNTYAWAQYNPNGQPFNRGPAEVFLDIHARQGAAPTFVEIPAVRLIVRAGISGTVGIEFSTPLPDMASQIPEIPMPNQTALLHVFHNGALVERFAWKIPQSGELEPVEALIRAVADSKVIRTARLLGNPGPTQTFMGPNYWLVGTPGAQPSEMTVT